VTAISSGHSKISVTACARAGPAAHLELKEDDLADIAAAIHATAAGTGPASPQSVVR
jgi:hypothetical protein